MSTLSLRKIKHDSSSVDNITLNSDGTTTANRSIIIDTTTNGVPSISLKHANTDADNFIIQAGTPGITNGGFSIRDIDAAANRFIIDSAGRVTTPYQPAFRAQNTSMKTVNGNSNVLICDAADLNIGGHYNTSNGRFTAPVSGTYYISHEGLLDAPEDDQVDIRFYINGNRQEISSDYVESDVSTGYRKTRMTTIVYLNINDYIDVRPQSGGVYTWYGDNGNGKGHTSFKGFLIG